MDVAADVMIRDAEERDASAVQSIYAHHVLHGTASYDVEPPSTVQMSEKIHWVLGESWPFLIAEMDGEVVGYAYATQFRDRAAYKFTCENSIYVHPEWTSRGIGRVLLQSLVERSESCGFVQMVAVIGGADPRSIALHASCGFKEVGRLHAVGWKKGRWLDNVYMQRALSD